MKIKIINRSSFELPNYATPGASGLDLRANEQITILPMQRVLVATGLFIEIPLGYEAQIRSRSGLAIKAGIFCLNSPGTIDSDYRGELKVIVMNISDQYFTINKGDRIAQIIFQKVEHIEWQSVDTLENTERQQQGFGHTGLQ